MADGWQHSDNEIAEALSAGTSTVYRVKRDFVEYGLDVALSECDRPGGARKLDANEEALLVSIACSQPPKGRSFAECMRDLVDVHYPSAEKIRVVLDNLNTHRPGALYKAFPPEEARRILRRLEFHYTPAHASWLNMVEIEIGNMNQQCLDRRMPDWKTLASELAAWEKQRNKEKASIKWMFNIDKARKKLNRAYDGLNQSNSV